MGDDGLGAPAEHFLARMDRRRADDREATILDQHGEGIPSGEGLRIVKRAEEDDGMPHC
jgi:hypothetical protein